MYTIEKVAFVVLVLYAVLVLTACTQINTKGEEVSNISAFTSAVRQTTNSVNSTAPAFNDMNTCPPSMQRVDHTAGGGGDAHIGTTHEGSKFGVYADFGQGHKCR